MSKRRTGPETAGQPAASRLQHMFAAIARMQQSRSFHEHGFDAALRDVTETAADTLGVRYASVWLYLPDNRTQCVDQYDAKSGSHAAGFILDARHQDHFGDSTIMTTSDIRSVEALMARKDTRRFLEAHCVGPAIFIRLFNDAVRVGTFAIADDGEPREWSGEEQLFANILSSWTSQILQQEKRRLADEATEKRDAFYQALLAHSPDGMSVRDDAGNLLFQTRTSLRTLGYTPEEMMKMEPLGPLHPDDREAAWETYREILETGSGQLIARLRRKDGTWQPFEFQGRDLRKDPHIKGVLVSNRDVSRRLEAEQRLRQAEKLEALGRLAGGVAHELNNMLHPILTFTAATRERVSDEKLQHYLDIVLNSARSARTVVQRVQAFAQGRQQTDPTESRLANAIESATNTAGEEIPDNMHLEKRLHATGKAILDQVGLTQVLTELVKNAVAASFSGDRIEVSSRNLVLAADADKLRLAPGRYVEIAVRDQGSSMPPDVIDRVFEPFFTTKDVGQGCGLGLALAFGVVTGWKGTITVESEPGEGSTFRVLVPLTGKSRRKP